MIQLFLTFFLSMMAQAQVTTSAPVQNQKNRISETYTSVEEFSKFDNVEDGSIASLFRANRCDLIIEKFSGTDLFSLAPIELGIYAYCEPTGKDPEKMFTFAESKDPSNDVIVLLHARYRWKKYMLTANEIWEKLAETSHDPRIRNLAEEYLQGRGDEAESGQLIKNSIQILTGQVGVIADTNPQFISDSEIASSTTFTRGLAAAVSDVSISEEQYGFNEFIGNLSTINYDQNHNADMQTLALNQTAALRASEDRHFLFQVFGSYSLYGNKPFNGTIGLGIGQLWQFQNSEHRFVLSISSDTFYDDAVKTQEGSHIRGEQKSSVNLLNGWMILINGYLEHSNLGTDYFVNETLPYSNTEGGISLGLLKSVNRVSIIGRVSQIFRRDDQESNFLNSSSVPTSKKREDYTTELELSCVWKIYDHLELIGYLNKIKTRSNMSVSESVDRNIQDTSLGILLKSTF